jgi:hypothetical protein
MLVDATRLPGSVRPLVYVPRVGVVSVLPSRRPLDDIFRDVVNHTEAFPLHGWDCTCMDEYIREIYVHVLRAVPNVLVDVMHGDEFYEAKSRIHHVLMAVVRKL